MDEKFREGIHEIVVSTTPLLYFIIVVPCHGIIVTNDSLASNVHISNCSEC